MSRKSAADDYKLILTTDCLFTPDYPVMIPSIINMYLLWQFNCEWFACLCVHKM